MKKLIVVVVLFVGSFASAQDIPNVSVGDFPSQSQWAIGMVNVACDTEFRADHGYVGTISRVNGGVVYRVFADDKVVARARATSTSIFAKKTCF